MKTLNQALILLVFNFVGFWATALVYFLGTRALGLVDVQVPDFNEANLFHTYFLHVYTTFLICAIFSVSFLFLKDKMRYLFLGAPLAIPTIYGLFFLSRYIG